MESKDIVRNFKKIERTIEGNPFTRPLFDRNISIIVPDTCSIIDLQNMTRNYKGDESKYSSPYLFLDSLERENRRLLITDGIMNEVLVHKDIKVNDNVYEIQPDFADYIKRIYDVSNRFFTKFRYGADSEQVGLEVYWASKYACKDNFKKSVECFSDVDKEVLKVACLIGTGKLEISDSKTRDINLVHILSSDEHLLKGTEFMKREFGYSNINCINSK